MYDEATYPEEDYAPSMDDGYDVVEDDYPMEEDYPEEEEYAPNDDHVEEYEE